MNVRIGSRKSPLALWQTNWVADLLREAHPNLQVEVVTMDTIGDKILDVPLPKIGAKGLFTQELEDALLSDAIDMAVHSLKDLPTELPEGLKFQASPPRALASDAFISTRWKSFAEVPEDGVIATGSMRRQSQLASMKPGLRFESLRGNIDTRLRKLDENGWDGIIMAGAALDRLQKKALVSELLDPTVFVPAVSQGAVGIEVRIGRPEIDALLVPITCQATMDAVDAERFFLNALQGGCSVPLGAYARQTDSGWEFRAWIGTPDGTKTLSGVYRGHDVMQLAKSAVADFQERGAAVILGRT